MATATLTPLSEVKGILTDLQTKVSDGQKKLENRVAELESMLKSRAAYTVPGLEDEAHRFSFARALRGIVDQNWKGAEFEQEVMREGAKAKAKALGADTDSAGGYIVPPEVSTELIEHLKAQSVVIQMGARVMQVTGIPFEVPKQTGAATMYWVGENGAITASQQTFGQVTMTPHQAGMLVKLSRRLLRSANPAADALVRDDIAKQMALGVDLAALLGTGADGQPRGVAYATGVGTSVSITGAIEISSIVNLIGQIEDSNASNLGPIGIITHPRFKRYVKLHYLATAAGYTFPPLISDAEMEQRMGYRWLTTTQLNSGSGGSTGEIFAGIWSELMIAQWGGLEFMASDVAGDSTGGAMASNQTWIRALMDCDIQPRHGQAFAYDNTAATNTAATG